MQKSRKILCSLFPILLLSCLLLVLALFSVRWEERQFSAIQVEIPQGSGQTSLTLWQDSDGNYTVFLPSYCSLSDVRFRLNTSAPVTLDGAPLADGQSLEALETGRTYTLKINHRKHDLQILQSANVSTLYLQTASGTMKAIHADKKYSEDVTVTLLTPEGSLDHSGGTCTIRGRGNSTWVYEKRPYLLTFTDPTDLLGMGSANKWVLLANATDESNLRNKLVYDLAGQTGLAWTPRCEYVDLYLNGEYSGLYLLAERVETGTERLDISSDPESFLCKVDLTNRFASLENPIMTQLGRAVEIADPDNLSDARTDAIAEKVQTMEDAILSGNITGVLDLDSWVRRLLIDEITENLDGDRASSYFYYYNGLFYAGPVWDYDHIWGTRDTNLNPRALLAETHLKAPDKMTPYNNALYENPIFYARLTEIYEAEMLPLMRRLADGGIVSLGKKIASASAMNSVRWRHMFDQWNWQRTDAAGLADFLSQRLEFLNDVWLNGTEYYTVQVDTGGELNYQNFVVRPGERFTQLSQVQVPGVEDPQWIDAATGEIFSEDQPITRETQLNLVQSTSQWESRKSGLLSTAYFGTILAGILVLLWAECRRSRPKRRRNT